MRRVGQRVMEIEEKSNAIYETNAWQSSLQSKGPVPWTMECQQNKTITSVSAEIPVNNKMTRFKRGFDIKTN